jgi:hypothetical protein
MRGGLHVKRFLAEQRVSGGDSEGMGCRFARLSGKRVRERFTKPCVEI